ncbi:carboxy terminal-processing peptidase [Catenovulum maritimum]|uniref:Carboxy-terminal protease n=1 Tax=Catenovulum maritimum TaxID=1513271 RepID=A0A0J8GYQ7_9ALTE|nr:carboxy terminal-processing peptidase [Catenovulum maritimum]KMT66369.1 carboxy-terminal protease [Catenovulum maritimum]
MKFPVRSILLSSVLVFSHLVQAVDATEEIPELPKLNQESQHSLASKRIYHAFTREHYKRFSVDDDFSQKVFDRYIKQLDYNKQFFLASDIAELSVHKNKFDEAFYRGELDFVYQIYERNLVRRKEMFTYAISLLDKEMDFTKDDNYYYDREDIEWPTSVDELKEYWRTRVKYDALNLKLAGKEWPKIQEVLTKRYNMAIKRLSQSQSEDVFQTAMNAFARSIEAHTSYLSPRSADRFNQQINLELEGIGAVLYTEDDHTVIRELVPGAPAERSEKIKPKDKIVGVAQTGEEFIDVVGWRLDDVVDLIKGPKGTQVRLQLLKGDSADNQTVVVPLVRDKIRLEDQAASSKVYVPDAGPYQGRKLGVIEISSFYNGLTRDVIKEINSLQAENVEGLVVDLRGNGGGSLPESISLTGLFIEKGPVVQVRSVGNRVNVHSDQDASVLYKGPLIVMVDRYSASASEIFSAAIQDYERGIVVGEQTFGKGTVQAARPLTKQLDFLVKPLGNIHYTFAKFYRINGGSTQHKGVVPDINFPSAINAEEWGESHEENALPWDKIKSANYRELDAVDPTIIDKLTTNHLARIKTSAEFGYIFDDIKEYKDTKDKKFESLKESVRLAEKEKNKAKNLQRTNERLVRLGKAKVESIDDVPEDLEEPDVYLDETANILFDYIGQSPSHKLAKS